MADSKSQEVLGAIAQSSPAKRQSQSAQVVWGQRVVTVGGQAPVRIQSMTNTDTVDVIGTAIQVKELAIAGSEMVRITVNTPEAAAAVPLYSRTVGQDGRIGPSDWRLSLQRSHTPQ